MMSGNARNDGFATHTIPDRPLPVSDPSRQSIYTKFDPLMSGTPKASSSTAAAAAAQPHVPRAGEKLLDFATPEHPALSRSAAADLLTGVEPAKAKAEEPEDVLALSHNSDPGLSQGGVGTVRPSSLSPFSADRSHEQPRSGLRYTEADLRRRVEEAVKHAVTETQAKQQGELDGLRAQLAEERKNNQDMKLVVEQFEQAMMAMMQQNKESQSLSLSQLESEKAQLSIDLAKTEQAFADLHHKYEKLKEIAGNLRKNEESLKAAVETAQQALKKAEERYELLKSHAEKKIEAANAEIANVRDQFKNELKVQTAKMKLIEAELSQTQRKLAAKEQDNKELTLLCDDMLKQLEGRKA